MTNFERKVLKEIAHPGSEEELIWGAAMSEALGYLQGSGYVTRGSAPQITEAGRMALTETEGSSS